MSTLPPGLTELAKLYGIQGAYHDTGHRRRTASPDALFGTLRALGAPVIVEGDVADALRERRLHLARRGVEPAHVAWNGAARPIELRLPVDAAVKKVEAHLMLEDGEAQRWEVRVEPRSGRDDVIEGERFRLAAVALSGTLPFGMHRLTVEAAGQCYATRIISSPKRAWEPAPGRDWGVFLPLYALPPGRHAGVADFGDLEALATWVGRLGGASVGTLPLLAAFLDPPVEISPYAPVSRRFWNELYVDPECAPELERLRARAGTRDASAADGIPGMAPGAAPSSPGAADDPLAGVQLVDYAREMAAKRPLLEDMARVFFEDRSDRSPAFARFLEAYPQVRDYARFRAVRERLRSPWPEWPQRLRAGLLDEGGWDGDAARYHVYVQWLAHRQLELLSQRAGAARLYLDLPLGVHPHGYDVWRERELFATGASGGSPPDAFFTLGQNWGFPPLHPEAIRDDGYRYMIASVRNHLRYAGTLRIDHAMSLHRLFWVPDGLDARNGVYVRYPTEELYAILTLESHRQEARIVGEDLGTVTREVRRSMGRHGLSRMSVLQFEIAPDAEPPVSPPPRRSVASLNTHDMPTFAAFWEGLDIRQRLERGLLDEDGAATENVQRAEARKALIRFLRAGGWLPARPDPPAPANVLRAALLHLAAGPARTILVNLEDLWLEQRPQNVPGTGDELPNWKRLASFGIREMRGRDDVVGVLREIHDLRTTPVSLRDGA